MLNAVLVDDEPHALSLLRQLLEETEAYAIRGMFTVPQEALVEIARLSPQVVFLDIGMPGLSGLEMAGTIRMTCPLTEIVFITALTGHALDAYGTDAAGYLVKPLHRREIQRITARLRHICGDSGIEEPSPLIRCFGRMEVPGRTDPGASVRWRTAKVEELFALLLLSRDQNRSKGRIMEMLWPEADAERTVVMLHTTVYQMRKNLETAGVSFRLDYGNGGYCLSLPGCQCDFEMLEHMAQEAEQLDAGVEELTAPMSLLLLKKAENALALYRGGLLEEHGYLWVEPMQLPWQERMIGLVLRTAKLSESIGDDRRAARLLRDALVHSPWDESLHEALLSLYKRKGDVSAFMAHYRVLQQALMTELGEKPSAALQMMYHQMDEKAWT